MELPKHLLFIGGKWIEPVGGGSTQVLDPATNRPIAEVASGSKDDVDAAVHAARTAFDHPEWRGIDPSKRVWIVGFCVLLVGYNSVRAWLTARGQRAKEERRRAEAESRRADWLRRHPGEPPNPDFDFSDRDRQDPAGPKPV